MPGADSRQRRPCAARPYTRRTALKTLAILTDRWGWQEQMLAGAAVRAGLACIGASVRQALMDTSSAARPGLRFPGLHEVLPDAVFVRAIPAGSFEQVTLRLACLHGLGELGVLVYNDARSIERSIDKGATSLALHRRGVPQPDTWVCESAAAVQAIVQRECAGGHALVAKPLFGNRGKGLRLINDVADLPAAEAIAGVWYLQRFVGTRQGAVDWRVFVVGGRAIAAMQRRGSGWITNRHQGGECLPAALTAELAAPAEAAVAAVGAAYGGVDLIRAPNGELLVLEVNGIPAWSGLQSVTDVDIATALIHDLRQRLVALELDQAQ